MLVKRKQSGFSMIELMIGLAIGLIISTAVVAFIAATLKANSATVQSMKLNNELRALSEIIARDIRRARGMHDPLINIGSGCSPNPASTNPEPCVGLDLNEIQLDGNSFVDIDYPSNSTFTAECITYGYQRLVNPADADPVDVFSAVRLSETSGVGSVILSKGTTERDCSSGGTVISSNLLDIDTLTFENCLADPADPQQRLPNCYLITLTGKLRGDPDNIIQTYRTNVSVRSGQFN